MGRSGLVTVVNERNVVLAKAIAFNGGEHATALARVVPALWPFDLEMFHRMAICYRFGDRGLVLVDRATVIYEGRGHPGSGNLYRLTFDNPRYCPPPFPPDENVKIVTVETRSRRSLLPRPV